MYKLKYFVFAAMVAGLLAQVASAQTPANITALAGNGQIVCPNCINSNNPFPFVVLVTDFSNRPIPGATVTWNVASISSGGYGSFPGGVSTTTSTTATDGTAAITFIAQGSFFTQLGTPPTLYQVSAQAGAVSTMFSMTELYNGSGGLGLAPNILEDDNSFLPTGPITGISGQAGYTYQGQAGQSLKVGLVTPQGQGIQGVSIRIASNSGGSAAASCVTGPGADPGSVLTDSTGYATCTPLFSGSGQVTLILVIGGVPLCNCAQDPASPTLYLGLLVYFQNFPPSIAATVAAAVPSSLSVVSGSPQTATAGQPLGQQLVAQVNAQGGGTLSGQNVNWSVNPASAGTLTSVTGTSDVNGRVSNNLTLSGSAAGTVTVTVSLASNASFRASFTITAIPLITAGTITKAGGDGQFAIVSQQFTNPLVVQVTTNTGALAAGIPVSFGASGGAILSATSVSTGSNGQAQVTVTAPAIAGAITVTASVSGLPAVTFNLTASPPGPTFTANSFVNAADQKVGSISACGLATIIASGIAPGVQGTVSANAFGFGGLPTSLAGDTVTFGGALAPIVSVANISGSQQLTFQVPCNATTGSNSVSVSVGGGSAATTVSVLPYSPGVFQTTTIIALSSGGNYPMGIFVRPDGSFVSQTNAARKGEVITAFVTGLGAATPSVGNNALPLPTAISTANANPVVGVANQGVPVISAQLSPNLVGVYQVSFQIPSSIPSGTQVFSVGVPSGGQTYYSLGSAIPIQ